MMNHSYRYVCDSHNHHHRGRTHKEKETTFYVIFAIFLHNKTDLMLKQFELRLVSIVFTSADFHVTFTSSERVQRAHCTLTHHIKIVVERRERRANK